ncbi:MAG: methane monooxygenase/ammonia monooxygenase subunit C [Cycloclasticus sp.]
MSVVQNDVVKSGKVEPWKINFKPMILGLLAITAIMLTARWYQQWAAWDYGLDASDPLFDQYWMKVFWAQLIIEPILFFVFVGYLWLTRDTHLSQLSKREELNKMMFWISMLVVYAFSFYFAGSFYAEQDASWHQTVVRDTSFTPSHIFLFYMCMPVFIIIGFSLFFYAITRLPFFAEKISVPLLLVVCGPFMLLPTVGYNEWGHAFWLMEEYFTVPLHWGFVFFGWSIIALGGLLVQILGYMSSDLLPKVLNEKGELTS